MYSIRQSWYYIVIGAGHNGLTAACTVARAGKSALVIDQRPIIGGLAASHNYLPEAPEHFLSLGAMDDALMAATGLAKEFRLRQHGYEDILLEHPYGWMNEDGDTLLLFRDFDRTVDEIARYSRRDAQTYRDIRNAIDLVMEMLAKLGARHPAQIGKLDIAQLLLKAIGDRRTRKLLPRMLTSGGFELIAETFESEAMRGLWAFWSSMFSPATVPGGGIGLAGFGNVQRDGIFRPKGGMSGMMRGFEGFLQEHSGEIRLNAKVARIDVTDGRATGVTLTNGETLTAHKGVLANCAPQVALGELLPEADRSDLISDSLKHIPANSVAVAPFKIDMAAGRLGYNRAQEKRNALDKADLRKTTFMTGTLEQHMQQHQACLRGEPVSFNTPLYFSILSGADPSIAPAEGDVLYIYVNVPLHPVNGWQKEKQAYSAQIMAEASRFIDGLDSEIGRIETCPEDFIQNFSAPNGSYFHVDLLPTRLGMNRPAPGLGGYQTPIKGLFLAGSGSHPNGGVCGLPGKLGAECALANNK